MNQSNFVVYQMTHLPTTQYYVGSTADHRKRWARHRYEMRSHRHHNRYVAAMVSDGYDSHAWEFKILSKHPDEASAKAEEERQIRRGRRSRLCLNIGKHATGGDNLTAHPDRDGIVARRRGSQVAALALLTEDEKVAKWGRPGEKNGMFGRRHSDAAKAAVSAANKGVSRNKGVKRSVVTKAKLSIIASKRTGDRNAFYGKSHTAETKARISKAKAGQKPTNTRPIVAEGKNYESVTAAARTIGVSPALVIYRIKSKKWEYHHLINA